MPSRWCGLLTDGFSELTVDGSLNHKILVNAERDWKVTLDQLPPFPK